MTAALNISPARQSQPGFLSQPGWIAAFPGLKSSWWGWDGGENVTVQPHQAPRCAADSSQHCASPGSARSSRGAAVPTGMGSWNGVLEWGIPPGVTMGVKAEGSGWGAAPQKIRRKVKELEETSLPWWEPGEQILQRPKKATQNRSKSKSMLSSPCSLSRGVFGLSETSSGSPGGTKDKSLWGAPCTGPCNCVGII